MKLITTIGASALLAGTTLAETIYVPEDYPTIQRAVESSVNGDEIIVAPGTYTSVGDSVVDMLGKAITLRASGPAVDTIIDATEWDQYGILSTLESRGGTFTIDGFTIQNGSGGMEFEDCTPTIMNCIIKDTYGWTGGGIGVRNCNTTVIDCDLSDNVSDDEGGGIHAHGGSLTVKGCTIEGGSSCWGGGIYVKECEVMIDDCIITDNRVVEYYITGNGADGAGIYCRDSNVTIVTSTINANWTEGTGGSASNSGAGIGSNGTDMVIIDSVINWNNALGSGSGIRFSGTWNDARSLFIQGSSIDSNSGANGGGIYVSGGFSLDMINTQVLNNEASQSSGGGIYLNTNFDPQVKLTGCVVRNNVANAPGGGIRSGTDADLTLLETTVCGNSPDQIDGNWIDGGGNAVDEECPGGCCLESNCSQETASDCLAIGGSFLGEDTTCEGNPCDSCLPNELEDCNGNCCPISWVGDGYCDDGTYMYGGELIYLNCDEFDCDGGDCVCECPGDYNEDGVTSVDDLLLVIDGWGTYGVDDLLAVLDDWGCGG